MDDDAVHVEAQVVLAVCGDVKKLGPTLVELSQPCQTKLLRKEED